jgi:hypothetical protein
MRIAFRVYLGRIGINVLTQRAIVHAQNGFGILEKLVHQRSPFTTEGVVAWIERRSSFPFSHLG